MTVKGGTSQACAACKYQRRRCTAECPLAPYFPAEQPGVFQNAHRLFGVSNILKILKKVEPDQKATAMWSIIYQSNERHRDPVHGCLGSIFHLRYQICLAEHHLLSLHSRLHLLRQQHQHQQNLNHNPNSNDHDQLQLHGQLELVMAPPAYNEADAAVFAHNNNNNNHPHPMWGAHYEGGASLAAHERSAAFVNDCYDEMPFFDDRQSYNVDSKQAYDSGSEELSVLKAEEAANDAHAIDGLVDNELKNAAACLSLTSVN